MIGTSEIPIAGMYANEILNKEALPIKYVATSHCFRKEAGRGELSKGIYRLHQFSKVEMFAFTEGNNDYSNNILSDMVGIQEEII